MDTVHDVFTSDRHELRVEEPNAVFMRLEGDVTGRNITDFLDVIERIGGGSGAVIIVQDLSRVGSFAGSARKTIADDKRTSRVQSVICVGASFQMRVIMTMIQKTMRLTGRPTTPALFAGDEDEMRGLLSAERKRLADWNGA